MIRPVAIALLAALALLAVSASGADEVFPLVHNEPITVRILNGKDGQPLAHLHLTLLAGYDQRDIHDRLWRQETLTDEQGRVQPSSQLRNLPWLQVLVSKLCQTNSRQASFSVERIRRDGLSAPNRCGIATVQDAPGVFTVFVKGKSKSSETEDSEDKPDTPDETNPVQKSAQTETLKLRPQLLPAPAAAIPAAIAPVAVVVTPNPAWPHTAEFSISKKEILAENSVTSTTKSGLQKRIALQGKRRARAKRAAHPSKPVLATCQAPPPAAKTTSPTGAKSPAAAPVASKR